MTNGEYFVLTHPDVKVEENGTCVWIYNLDSTICNHYTMSMEWWNEEMVDIRPKGKWEYTTHYGRRYRICPVCGMEREDDRSAGWYYCPNCGARME